MLPNLTSGQSSKSPTSVTPSQPPSGIHPLQQVKISRPINSKTKPSSWTQYLPGIPRFAAFMAQDKDKSTTIYRRFEHLSARNLLYLESEISELEAQLELQDCEASGDTYLQLAAQDWNLLKLQASVHGNADPIAISNFKEKMAVDDETMHRIAQAAHDTINLIRRLEDTLKRYHEGLKLQSDILALRKPKKSSLKEARKIFKPPSTEDTLIHGHMAKHLDEENDGDLCVLKPQTERVILTRLFAGCLSNTLKRNPKNKHILSRFGCFLGGILPTIFIIGGVFALYFIKRPIVKLLVLCAFIGVFAGTMSSVTKATRHEIFVGTAAYAAVLVVFVSGDLAASASAQVMDNRLGHSNTTASASA